MPIIGEPTMKPLLCALAGEIARRLAMSLDVRGVQNKHVLAEWNEVLIDAEFVVCYGHLHRSLHALTYRRNIPLVMINEATGLATDGAFESPPIVDGVSWDAAAHVNTLLDFLVAKGARRLLFVASANLRRNHPLGHAVESEAKVEAFQTYMAAHPQLSGEALLPEALPEITDTFFEARNSYRLLMAKEDVFKGVDAVVGHNDIVAQGIIAALRARGLAPGEDVMVIGDGDFLEYRYCVPAVTTVDYDKEFLARSVCDILDRRFKDNRPAGENVLVPSRIIERETTRKP